MDSGVLLQADLLEKSLRCRHGLAPRRLAYKADCQTDVPQHGHMREQIEALEDHPDLRAHILAGWKHTSIALLHRGALDRRVVNKYLSGPDQLEPGDQE